MAELNVPESAEPRIREDERMELSPIILEQVQHGSRVLTFDRALQLEPTLDEESRQLLCVTDPSIDLNAFASTREQIVDEVIEQVFFLSVTDFGERGILSDPCRLVRSRRQGSRLS